MDYYCARLLIVCLVDDGKPRKRNTCDHPFFVFRARDYEHAFALALTLGKQQETRYKNSQGQPVRWAFVQVENIRRLGKTLDGVEAGSVLGEFNSPKPVPFQQRFSPGKSQFNLD